MLLSQELCVIVSELSTRLLLFSRDDTAISVVVKKKYYISHRLPCEITVKQKEIDKRERNKNKPKQI